MSHASGVMAEVPGKRVQIEAESQSLFLGTLETVTGCATFCDKKALRPVTWTRTLETFPAKNIYLSIFIHALAT